MIPISLTISGFLSYREATCLDFTSFELACIAGPNGAGKSSLLDAITYALFGKARKADETLINLHPEVAEAFVELVFDYEGNRYRVQRTNPRGKSSVLEFQIAQLNNKDGEDPAWKTLTERTLRDTQRRIEETLRLDYDTFVNASFFLQGKADQFTQQRPADRKRILSSILGLESWEGYRLRAAGRRKALEMEVASLDGRLEEIRAELAEEDVRRKNLAHLTDDLERLELIRSAQEGALEYMRKIQAAIEEQQRLVDAMGRRLSETRQRLEGLEQRLDSRRQEEQTIAAVLDRGEDIRSAHESLKQARTRLAEWDRTAAQFRQHESKRAEPLAAIREVKAGLEAEKAALVARREEVEGALEMEPALGEQMAEARRLLAQLEVRQEEKIRLETELQAAQRNQASAAAENPRLKQEMDTLKARIDRLKETDEGEAICPLCGQPLAPEHRRDLVETLEKQGKEKGDQYRANKELLQQADETVKGLEGEIAALAPVEGQIRQQDAAVAQIESQLEQIAATRESWEAGGAARLEEIEQALTDETYAQEARDALQEIDRELKAIGYDAAEHDRIRQQADLGEEVEAEVRELERAEAALEPLAREIADLGEQIAGERQAVESQQEAHEQGQEALLAAQAEAPDLFQGQREMMEVQERVNRLRMEVGAAQQKVNVLEDLAQRQAELSAEKEGQLKQIGLYRRLERAFGKDGVPALLIEQALPQIESRANHLLERLSGGEMSVRFQTQRALKSRPDLRETLDIQISDGAGIRDYEMYSGGEAFRVNFAIRLALSEVLAHRAGARLQTLVIDEGFGSQDSVGRQRLIEAINMVRKDFAKVLVITHIEELKEAFPTRIEIEKSERGSGISLVQ